MAPLADSLDALLGESEFSTGGTSVEGSSAEAALPQAIYHWNKAPTQAFARLKTGEGADDVSFLFSIQHPKFVDSIAELPPL